MPSVPLLLCLLHTQSPYVFMLLCLLFLCYHVFYILCPLCLYVILASVSLLLFPYILRPLCLYVILASVHYVHSGFINVKYFY